LIAEPLFRVKYVEKAGTGTTDMIADCRKAGLPEPDFEQRGPHFVVTLWRDWITHEVLSELNLNDRQQQVVTYVKKTGKITNSEYQRLMSVAKRTAHRDLSDLVEKGLFIKIGTRGKGTFYKIQHKGP
jgi:ATP-dependent DNA helicase RecG